MSRVPSGRMFLQAPPSATEALERAMADPDLEVASPRRAAVEARLRLAMAAPRTATLEPPPALVGIETDATAARTPGLAASHMQFREIYSSPENQIFKVVFFPDRVFHAQYLNASRAADRYRYVVSEARSILDISVLKAQVYLDGRKLANLLRLEYRQPADRADARERPRHARAGHRVGEASRQGVGQGRARTRA